MSSMSPNRMATAVLLSFRGARFRTICLLPVEIVHERGEEMNDEPEPESTFDKTRIVELLQYSGPSSRLSTRIEDGVTFIDYRDTDNNERNITLLLSSQNIPCYIERPTGRVRR